MASNQQNIRLGDQLESLEKEIRGWARITKKQLAYKLPGLNLKQRIQIAKELDKDLPLKASLGYSVRKKQGDLESVAFTFVRHGIFFEHGVGRGRLKGSSAAKKAANPWLSEVLPDATDELANILEEKYSDLIQSELRLLIPGVIDVNLKPLPEFINYNDGEKDIKIVIDKSFF